MTERLLADVVLLVHFGFVAFVVAGGLLALRWPRVLWVHVPAVIWAVVIETVGGICPLTPIESRLRRAGGGQGFEQSFVEHYLMPLVYPPGLTRELQWLLAAGVVVVNAAVYLWVWRRYKNRAGDRVHR